MSGNNVSSGRSFEHPEGSDSFFLEDDSGLFEDTGDMGARDETGQSRGPGGSLTEPQAPVGTTSSQTGACFDPTVPENYNVDTLEFADQTSGQRVSQKGVPTTSVRRQYVTIHFPYPGPASLGLRSLGSWTAAEKAASRRLVAFSCTTNYASWSGIFVAKAIASLASLTDPKDPLPPNSKVISCIYVPPQARKNLGNTCIITSYDFIELVKWMINSPAWFDDVGERNRVRRNLEGFKPVTLRRESEPKRWDVHNQVLRYKNPQPWHIMKDFKVFNWEVVELMMSEIIRRYSIVVPEGMEIVDVQAEEALKTAHAELFGNPGHEVTGGIGEGYPG